MGLKMGPNGILIDMGRFCSRVNRDTAVLVPRYGTCILLLP